MEKTYELWDVETANIIGSFPTQKSAMSAVKTLLDSYGLDYAGDLSLSCRTRSQRSFVIAAGEQLLAMTDSPQVGLGKPVR